jgi:hypothetical protein
MFSTRGIRLTKTFEILRGATDGFTSLSFVGAGFIPARANAPHVATMRH